MFTVVFFIIFINVRYLILKVHFDDAGNNLTVTGNRPRHVAYILTKQVIIRREGAVIARLYRRLRGFHLVYCHSGEMSR